LKPLQESVERGMKEMVEEVNSSMTHLIHCMNLYKCHSVPPPNTTIKGEKKNSLFFIAIPE
jgi:succinate dehydrogenase/fumarate reductase-like Fe-S protein